MLHQTRLRLILTLFVCVLCIVPVATAAADLDSEVWLGAGGSWPDYRDAAMACVRGGAGIVVARHFAIGASGHGDRDHSWYFGDASTFLPPVGLFEPYARFHIGRRDHSSENAMAWTAGVRVGDDAIRISIEGFGIFEPDENYGMAFGISF